MSKRANVLLATILACVGCAADTGLESTREAILGGYTETATSAVVRILFNGEHCTGTLIRPDLVLTNGHCLPGGGGMVSNYGRWNAFLSSAGDATITVGPTDPPTFTTTGHYFMQPPAAPDGMGQDDVVLIGLNEVVPASAATWLRVASNAPGLTPLTPNPSWVETVIGWGEYYQGRATTRVAGNMTGAFGTCTGQSNMRWATWTGGATTYVNGDSGSPLLLPSGQLNDIPGPSGRVVAGVMGNGSCGTSGFLTTYTTGDFTKPNIASWLTTYGTRSFCAQHNGIMTSVLDPGYRRLMSWFSDQRQDNFSTTQDGYFGCYPNWTDVTYPNGSPYGFVRQDGWVLDPSRPAPHGTIPLVLFWNSSTFDYATVITAPGGAWSPVGLLGYIWVSPGTDLVALRLWYNPTIQDYFTTILTGDYSGLGYMKVGGGGTGIIGYVRTTWSVL